MIYLIEAVGLDRVKIGSAKDDHAMQSRWEAISCGCPVEVALLGVLAGGQREEHQLHDQFARYRIRGEWFLSTPVLEVLGQRLQPWRPPFACSDCGAPVHPKTVKRRGSAGRCRDCVSQAQVIQGVQLVCEDCGRPVARVGAIKHHHAGTKPRCAPCAWRHAHPEARVVQ